MTLDLDQTFKYASLMREHLLGLSESVSLDERAKHAEIALAASNAIQADIAFMEFSISVDQLNKTGEHTIFFETADTKEAERMAKSPEFKALYAQYLKEMAAKESQEHAS